MCGWPPCFILSLYADKSRRDLIKFLISQNMFCKQSTDKSSDKDDSQANAIEKRLGKLAKKNRRKKGRRVKRNVIMQDVIAIQMNPRYLPGTVEVSNNRFRGYLLLPLVAGSNLCTKYPLDICRREAQGWGEGWAWVRKSYNSETFIWHIAFK